MELAVSISIIHVVIDSWLGTEDGNDMFLRNVDMSLPLDTLPYSRNLAPSCGHLRVPNNITFFD
jgi:hypothetical protein